MKTMPSKCSSSRSRPVTMRARQRRRHVLVEARDVHVGRHDARDVGLDGRAERLELHLAQALGRVLDERQCVVGVDARVAVPRKVLAARGDAPALQFLDDRPGPMAATRSGSLDSARSPMTGFDGLVRTSSTGAKSIVMPTADSSQASAAANRRASASPSPAAGTAERRHRRPLGERRTQARDAAAFLVHADPQGAWPAAACGRGRRVPRPAPVPRRCA